MKPESAADARASASPAHRILFVTAVLAAMVAAAGAGAQTDDTRPNWRVMWANDAIFGSDNQFSNGFGAAKHSALAESLDEAGGTPAFGRWLARFFLPSRDGLYFREGWTVGHNLQTPDNIKVREINLDDVPYVSMIGWTNSHIAFDNRRFTGFQTLVGWVGDITLGEQIQSTAHKISNANDPKGWDKQLDNEPLFNVYWMKKYKLFDSAFMDVTGNADIAAGNMFTFGQTALEFRFGDRPDGFAYQVNTIGHNLDYDARIHAPGKSYLYTSVILRGSGVLHALPRDGNLIRNDNEWTDDNRLNAEEWIGQAAFGLHYERANWGLHANLFISSSAVESPSGNNVADPNNNFAVLLFEWQF
ncbi:MAG: lipid A deacylase LpxR family protein [Wenzhouxiangellaceae bacterium]|nr:lipid A deacylase LpxR family protein [Wenzhouxiangellaceae bacterium]